MLNDAVRYRKQVSLINKKVQVSGIPVLEESACEWHSCLRRKCKWVAFKAKLRTGGLLLLNGSRNIKSRNNGRVSIACSCSHRCWCMLDCSTLCSIAYLCSYLSHLCAIQIACVGSLFVSPVCDPYCLCVACCITPPTPPPPPPIPRLWEVTVPVCDSLTYIVYLAQWCDY